MNYTADEMMSVAAARALADGMSCFVGIGLPSTAANLARRTHAPNLTLIYESGCLGAKPSRLPLSIGDGELADWCAAALAAGGARVISVRVDADTTGRAELAARVSQALAGGESADVPPGEAAEASGGEDAPIAAGNTQVGAERVLVDVVRAIVTHQPGRDDGPG